MISPPTLRHANRTMFQPMLADMSSTLALSRDRKWHLETGRPLLTGQTCQGATDHACLRMASLSPFVALSGVYRLWPGYLARGHVPTRGEREGSGTLMAVSLHWGFILINTSVTPCFSSLMVWSLILDSDVSASDLTIYFINIVIRANVDIVCVAMPDCWRPCRTVPPDLFSFWIFYVFFAKV